MTSAFQADDPGSNPGPRTSVASKLASHSVRTRELNHASRSATSGSDRLAIGFKSRIVYRRERKKTRKSLPSLAPKTPYRRVTVATRDPPLLEFERARFHVGHERSGIVDVIESIDALTTW